MDILSMLKDNHYHSPELSETDDENNEEQRVNVYDLLWRSDEVLFIYVNFSKVSYSYTN